MATEFRIDGILSGTDVRDVPNGGYVDPMPLGLSEQLGQSVSSWQAQCEEAHFAGFANERTDFVGVIETYPDTPHCGLHVAFILPSPG